MEALRTERSEDASREIRRASPFISDADGRRRCSELRELSSFSELLDDEFASKRLFVLDMDDTLYRAPNEDACSRAWWLRTEREVGAEETLRRWKALLPTVGMRPACATVMETLRALHARGARILVLTARDAAIGDTTMHQLTEVLPLLYKDLDWMLNGHLALHEEGVLSCGAVCKGRVLREVLSRIDVAPRDVLFVDDSVRNCAAVVRAFADESAPVTVLRARYPYLVQVEGATDAAMSSVVLRAGGASDWSDPFEAR